MHMFRIVRLIKSRNFPILNRINECNYTKLNNGRIIGSHFYSTSIGDKDQWIVMTDNGNTIVCWHPEKHHPYEHTLPLPEIEPELKEGDSLLKIQYRLEDHHRYRPEGPNMEELQALTFTTKHRWYPKPEKKYDDPNPPIDRDGL
ncbi:large ribosomal subunit protein mL42 [Centruroides vittatus]|uniref:large ribosomal subunit protein mL42 n=1 Tax=Centruroides vittatus TaxID=120091 RepID=UPI00351075F8